MAQQNAELEKKAENIARQATKIYPKSSANTVVLTPVTTSQGHTLSVVKMDHDLLGSGQNVATTPPHQSHSHGLGSALPSQSSHSAKKAEKVRKTPPHILKAKKEYYQHNRETILSKQKEYKKRIATGVKKKEEQDIRCPNPVKPLLSPISTERLEQIEREANQFRRKLNVDGKPIFPKKRWADVKIRVIDTKHDTNSVDHNTSSENNSETSSVSSQPSMSAGMPKKFIVDEYEFTDNDTSTVHASNLKHTATESRLKPLPSPPVVMEPTYRDVTVGSTNGVITPVHQRKSFKKQLAMDWENRHSLNGLAPDNSSDVSTIDDVLDTDRIPTDDAASTPLRKELLVQQSSSRLTAEPPSVSVPSEA